MRTLAASICVLSLEIPMGWMIYPDTNTVRMATRITETVQVR
jgi:hypothetical protein